MLRQATNRRVVWLSCLALFFLTFINSNSSDLIGSKRGTWESVEAHMLKLQSILEKAAGGKENIIGNIAFHPSQANYYHRAVKREGVRRICEVGFGPGLSSVIYLASNQDAQVYNFDLFPFVGDAPELLNVEYVERQPQFQPAAVEYIENVFPGRFHAIKGHSNSSIGEFAKKHSGFQCDFISIDGSHIPPQPFFDILHFSKLAHESSILLLDDMQALRGELDRACALGLTEYKQCLTAERYVDERFAPWPIYDEGKEFCEARYIFPQPANYLAEQVNDLGGQMSDSTTDEQTIASIGSHEREFLFGQSDYSCQKPPEAEELYTNLHSLGYKAVSHNANRETKLLPRLAIVISISADMFCEYKSMLSAANCYAASHGIPLYIETEQLQLDRHYFYSRTLHVKKYLPYFQWILHLDADVTFIDMSRNIVQYIDDEFDIIFGLREQTAEIFNAGYLVKNSAFGFEFLDNWLKLSDDGVVLSNYDNGDLIQVILRYMDISAGEHCASFRAAADYVSFVSCFQKHLKAFSVHENRYVVGSKILIYGEYDWLMRTYEPAWGHEYFSSIFVDDFVGHGKKHYGTIAAESLLCVQVPKENPTIKSVEEKKLYLKDIVAG